VEFHEPLPPGPLWGSGEDSSYSGAFPVSRTCTPGSPGTDPLGPTGEESEQLPNFSA
jgi:hypothetical protein